MVSHLELIGKKYEIMKKNNMWPQFVRIADSRTTLRLVKTLSGDFNYYVDGGCWGVDFNGSANNFSINRPLSNMNGDKLEPITYQEWLDSNTQYNHPLSAKQIIGYLIEGEFTENTKPCLEISLGDSMECVLPYPETSEEVVNDEKYYILIGR